ncbi:unnamed protein product [Discula destructiva]
MSDQGGSMTEVINVLKQSAVPVPHGADPVQVAGLVNLFMASWMAIAKRTARLQPGFTALIIGVTGVSVVAAVDVVRMLGAAKVVGVARSAAKMARLGPDAAVELASDPAKVDWTSAMDVDVILDFLLWALHAVPFQSLEHRETCAVCPDWDGGGAYDRSARRHSQEQGHHHEGDRTWFLAMKDFGAELPRMIEAIASGKVRPGNFQATKMADIETVWAQKGYRMIITP